MNETTNLFFSTIPDKVEKEFEKNNLSVNYTRNRILSLTLVLFSIVALTLGSVANEKFGRSFGVYSLFSIFAILIFLCGFVSVFMNLITEKHPLVQIILGQIYFLGMLIVIFAGIIAGIVYISKLKDKISEYYCDLPEVKNCTGVEIQRIYDTLTPIMIFLGIFVAMEFIYFCRLVYKWLSRMERYHGYQNYTILSHFINAFAKYLPNYTFIILTCFHFIKKKCDCKCDCNCDYNCDCNCDRNCKCDCSCLPSCHGKCYKYCALCSTLICCISLTILCIIVDVEKWSFGWQLFCIIWRLILELFCIIGSKSNNCT